GSTARRGSCSAMSLPARWGTTRRGKRSPVTRLLVPTHRCRQCFRRDDTESSPVGGRGAPGGGGPSGRSGPAPDSLSGATTGPGPGGGMGDGGRR
ncbi:hypothetical protein, partial [Escherichia coli]|uniref:hypothetical protein n=1 Tax=Escherichia coli TaxID=562 RepID=UPI001916B373